MEEVCLISETGETFCVSNLKEFARDKGLDISALHKVLKRQRKSHKGYRLKESETIQTKSVHETENVSICPKEFEELKNRVKFLEDKIRLNMDHKIEEPVKLTFAERLKKNKELQSQPEWARELK